MDVKVITKPIFVAVLTLAGPCAFASAITYDFTGKVLFGQGSFISSNGSTVSGTFTIDFDAAVPTQSFGSPASSPTWQFQASGGTEQNSPPPTGFVYSESVTLNGTTYDSAPADPTFTASLVSGQNASGSLHAGVVLGAPGGSSWYMDLGPTSGTGVAAYLSNGLPNLAAVSLTGSDGNFTVLSRSQPTGGFFASGFTFSLSSLTAEGIVPPGSPVPLAPPVPVPAAVWLLASGLGMLGTLRTRWGAFRTL